MLPHESNFALVFIMKLSQPCLPLLEFVGTNRLFGWVFRVRLQLTLETSQIVGNFSLRHKLQIDLTGGIEGWIGRNRNNLVADANRANSAADILDIFERRAIRSVRRHLNGCLAMAPAVFLHHHAASIEVEPNPDTAVAHSARHKP